MAMSSYGHFLPLNVSDLVVVMGDEDRLLNGNLDRPAGPGVGHGGRRGRPIALQGRPSPPESAVTRPRAYTAGSRKADENCPPSPAYGTLRRRKLNGRDSWAGSERRMQQSRGRTRHHVVYACVSARDMDKAEVTGWISGGTMV